MTVIVNNGTEHVEQKRRALRGNKISCRRRSMVGAKAAPPPRISDCNQEENILSGPDFRDINVPENGPCAHQPQDYC